MNKKRWKLLLMVLILLISMIPGCEKEKEKVSEYHIYYIDKNKTRTVAVGYEPTNFDTQKMIAEMIEKLSENTNSPDYRKVLPKEVEIQDWKLENAQLYLYFNKEYQEMDHVAEILCRSCIVRTLIQVKGVDCISFYVGDAPLTDEKGAVIGLMTGDSFIENPGEQINTIQTTNITLYFANKDGTKLVQEVQKQHYSSNISVEKLIMEQLLKGPKGKELRGTVPYGTKLLSVSVLDGVCFVNLDAGFLNQNYEITEPVVIYSIVNSLVELPNINKVQISVNGDSSMVYREKYELSTMYERDLDYMDSTTKKQEEQIAEDEKEEKQKEGV
ncbi:MAG: GerMN domain-containing protein, partial [Lachnospiraceae bacterium]